MLVLNLALISFSFISKNLLILPYSNKYNINMNQNNFDFLNSTKGYTNGLKLMNAKSTQDQVITWLYATMNEPKVHPTFVRSDLVSTLSYASKEIDRYDLFIGYKPDKFEDPEFIGCFNIDPEKRLLCIEQICTNPFAKETSLTDYKKKLSNLAKASGVLLYPKPLKYLINPRYYLEFSHPL